MIPQSITDPTAETTLHLWRTAAEAVATDPITQRHQAYQAIIVVVRQQLLDAVTLGDLMSLSGRAELHGIAIRESLSRGTVLNADVIVAAACWQHLCSLVARQQDVSIVN